MNKGLQLLLTFIFANSLCAAPSLERQFTNAIRELDNVERVVRAVNIHSSATPITERYLLQKVVPEQLSYIRTARAALVVARQDPTLLNLYNASTALTGVEYDLKSLEIVLNTAYTREKVGTGTSGQSLRALRAALQTLSGAGDAIYAGVSARMATAH